MLQFYTTGNNAARSETVEQARELDDKVKQCWSAHPNVAVIDNSTDFKVCAVSVPCLLPLLVTHSHIPHPPAHVTTKHRAMANSHWRLHRHVMGCKCPAPTVPPCANPHTPCTASVCEYPICPPQGKLEKATAAVIELVEKPH